jgi:hypothetical protein
MANGVPTLVRHPAVWKRQAETISAVLKADGGHDWQLNADRWAHCLEERQSGARVSVVAAADGANILARPFDTAQSGIYNMVYT